MDFWNGRKLFTLGLEHISSHICIQYTVYILLVLPSHTHKSEILVKHHYWIQSSDSCSNPLLTLTVQHGRKKINVMRKYIM